MKFKLILLFCFIYNITFSQKIYKTAIDTTLIDFENDYWKQMQEQYAHLPAVKDSQYKYHFRYDEFSQVADIYSNDGINFKGNYLNNIIELADEGSQKKNSHNIYLYSYKKIDSDAASKMGQWIIKEKIHIIPSEEAIKGWNGNIIGGDCFRYSYKINDSVINARYACPRCQNDTVQGAATLTKFHAEIKSVLATEEQFRDFNIRFKGGKYYSGYIFSWYAPTKKERKEWIKNKAAREWLATYDQEIDARLKEYATKAEQYLPPEGEYTLYFSKEGNLKKIRKGNIINDADSPLNPQVGRQIQTIFKDSNLKEMNLEYDFIKIFRIYRSDYYTIQTPEGYWRWCL